MNLRSISPIVGRGLLIGKKYSPEILTVAGIAGFITAGILASKATVKLEETLDNSSHRVSVAKITRDPAKIRKAKVLAATDLIKLYGPAFTLAALSTASIVGAHGIMRKRVVVLGAAYKVLESTLTDYRKRVVDEYGEEKDAEFIHGYTTETVVGEDGKKHKVKRAIDGHYSEYSRMFDGNNPNWSSTPEYNLIFLRANQNYANDLLKSRGHVFLNDVYDALGLSRTAAGAVTGWVFGNQGGDNYIDFGFEDKRSEYTREFMLGETPSILLDFNVDGIVYDLLP